MKILSIGNSFSQDAQRYLHRLAANEGVEIECVDLVIGGCSLQQHSEFLTSGRLYGVERNGISDTGETATVIDGLQSDNWDYVTLQQVSHCAPRFETYMPYLTDMAEVVRKYAPEAKLLLHQTWAYEQNSQRLTEELGYKDQHDMLADIRKAYAKAAEAVNAAFTIRAGEAMMAAVEKGVKVHRDTFHAGLGAGRYLLAMTWYMTLTGKRIQNGFIDIDEPADIKILEKIKQAAEEVVFGK